MVPSIKACYVRSSPSEPSQLGAQQETYLKRFYPYHRMYVDIGSGHDPHRDQFNKLMDDVHAGKVIEIVVISMDRLGTHGIELIEQSLRKLGVALVIPETKHMREHIGFTYEELAVYLESGMDELEEAHRVKQRAFVNRYNELTICYRQEPANHVIATDGGANMF